LLLGLCFIYYYYTTGHTK